MKGLMSYSGIVTKIKAMQAKLLTENDFDTIAGLGSVLEAIEYLKGKTAYEPYLNQMDVSLYHRGNVEKMLYQSLYSDYTKIYHFAGIEQKKFLKLYWKRYEVDLINYCLRIVFNHYDVPFDLSYKRAFFDKYSEVSIDKLITSKNIDELVENLRGTEYFETLNRIRESGAATLFDYNLALDIYYFQTIWKREKKILKGKELELFTRDCGTKIDLMNMQWIYRAKKYYHMMPVEIYALTIPIHYHLRIDEFKKLVDAPSLEEFMNLAAETRYAHHYQFEDGRTLERLYKDTLKHLYLTDRKKNPYSIAAINTYLFLKEEEIDKLTTALECIRYGLTKGETLAYLGGVVQ